jgi:hypothetical protein
MLRELADGEAQIRWLMARRQELMASIAPARRSEFADEDPELTERAIAMEVAASIGVSAASARAALFDSEVLTQSLPTTLAALRDGRLGAFAARQIAAALGFIPAETASAIDELLAAEAAQLLPGQVRAAADARVTAVDPESASRRAKQSRCDRWVWFEPMPDAVAGIGAVLPAEQAIACWHALDDHARGRRADGDDRTMDQIMADTLVERVTGASRADHAAAIELNVVITDQSLLGASDAPADLAGFGAVPADLARELSSRSQTWVRRLLTDPIDASVLTVDTGRRRFDGALRRLIKLRDRRCRNPYCNAPVRDIDHREAWIDGGATTASNGHGYCKRCHRLKDHPGVSVTRIPPPGDNPDAHRIVWRTPGGDEHPSLAPPALGHGSPSLDQLKHRQELLDRDQPPT